MSRGRHRACSRREVSLADALKKPLIPLLLERVTWPPEGPMGPILTQLLYVNFAQSDESVLNSWNSAEFKELLKNLSSYTDQQPMVGRMEWWCIGAGHEIKIQTLRTRIGLNFIANKFSFFKDFVCVSVVWNHVFVFPSICYRIRFWRRICFRSSCVLLCFCVSFWYFLFSVSFLLIQWYLSID